MRDITEAEQQTVIVKKELQRGESQVEKQVKEARTKCRSIASLLTDAPNPNSKGVLMFKKRRQRAKKKKKLSLSFNYPNNPHIQFQLCTGFLVQSDPFVWVFQFNSSKPHVGGYTRS
uniref:Uncharacterized protein n=1 Tax=Knipowitschia caucasica TaxID=637954 RepID=A0AAV2LBL6_KNICA